MSGKVPNSHGVSCGCDSGSEWSTCRVPAIDAIGAHPATPWSAFLAEAESGGLTILEEFEHFEGDNAHAATLGLPGVIATMDGSSRSGM